MGLMCGGTVSCLHTVVDCCLEVRQTGWKTCKIQLNGIIEMQRIGRRVQPYWDITKQIEQL
jgi:hypothetical protein